MEIKISLSKTDLKRMEDVLGITSHDDIRIAFVEAMDTMLENEENSYDMCFIGGSHNERFI